MLSEILGASDTFNIMPHMIALAIAYVLALPIGWDREREERSAGLRTFPLVAIASCGFVRLPKRSSRGNLKLRRASLKGSSQGWASSAAARSSE